ncbi:MAG: hypothetical protein M1366_02455 [Patescibacteria group bacterium]|nr:hypothetical protein [Patescibacteria group bacterium]
MASIVFDLIELAFSVVVFTPPSALSSPEMEAVSATLNPAFIPTSEFISNSPLSVSLESTVPCVALSSIGAIVSSEELLFPINLENIEKLEYLINKELSPIANVNIITVGIIINLYF